MVAEEVRGRVETLSGAGLGAMWGEEKAKEMLKEAGFGEVEVERLPQDTANSYFVAKKG